MQNAKGPKAESLAVCASDLEASFKVWGRKECIRHEDQHSAPAPLSSGNIGLLLLGTLCIICKPHSAKY